ncbi:FAD-dependent oxidoreductase [Saccharomonospora sp. CUA-673]|uniref:FAD-dependent monooxygenase n=1 Tax=Saccharomonospora sp. CUA-673 TaxID=1904969 RepID=UPI00096558A9|nr:FAD-dependent monooxygenase [Saccharomonospora sp. CUA-673]OLT48751.1 FAD-dependent oxidoreductase [Saccharomonospora sp. CUA-673]
MSVHTAQVGIVGAGPVGMIAALRLADAGVSSVLLDSKPYLVKQGSKACLIQGDVLEVLERAGCAQPIADEGVTWTIGRTYVRDKVMRSTTYPRGPGFGPFVNISQYRIEQVLAEAVERHPLCELRWGHEVVAVDQDADSVTLRAHGPEETADDLRFAYVVAADGVRSTMRELLGVEWTGYTHSDRFLITDIKADLPLAKERHFHYDPSFNPGRQLVMHPQPDDVWRIDWQLPPDADIEAERRDGTFDARVRAVIGDVEYEIDWVSTYRFHQRVVDQLVVGRVLFAGDAAHALPPYGSRGMNSGIQDADNLAWKIGAVLNGQSPAQLVETYHAERYAAAKENLRVTEATIRFMVPPSRIRRWTRALLLALAHSVGAARDRVNSGRMAEPYVYDDSPIVAPQHGNALLGSFLPDPVVHHGGTATRLRKLIADGFAVLVVADDLDTARTLVRAAGAAHAGLSAGTGSGVGGITVLAPDTVPGDAFGADVPVAHAPASELERFATGWWLVRPDGHLAAHGPAGATDASLDPVDPVDAEDSVDGVALDLAAALRRCLGHDLPATSALVKEAR